MGKFGAFFRVIENTKRLNINDIAAEVYMDPNLQAQIVELNTERQLYDKGEDAEGNGLGQYAPFTMQYKATIAGRLGRDTRTDHITLKDTGDFYRSFRFVQERGGFRIAADTVKEGGDDLVTMYGQKILGLSDESINEIIPEIKEATVIETRKQITK